MTRCRSISALVDPLPTSQSRNRSVTPASSLLTAAPVSITGRVATAEGIGIGGAALSLSSPSGEVRGAISSPFGYFRFDDVQSGEVYLLTIRSKRFAFADPVRTFFLSDALDGVDFVGSPGKRAAPCYLSGFSRKQC